MLNRYIDPAAARRAYGVDDAPHTSRSTGTGLATPGTAAEDGDARRRAALARGAQASEPAVSQAGAPAPASPARRRFLEGSAGAAAALVIGLHLPEVARAQQGSGAAAALAGDSDAGFAPNAFVRIAADDTVTVLIKHIEFGQGPYTGLATLVAEELDADWSQMRAEAAPTNAELYANLLFGVQGTGGSTAMANSYEQMRKAGAAARAMLVAAAAKEWGVNAAEITVEKGRIRHPSGEESGFGAMAALAAGEAVPAEPSLKDPKDFTLIGTELPKLDTAAKTRGQATYSIDVYRDGMLTAVVRHPSRFGASVAAVDDAAALAVPGVVAVRTIPQGVAVYATGTYAALKGRDALEVDWDTSAAETRSTEEMIADWRERAREPGLDAERRGDIDAAVAEGGRALEAEYVFPYLAHAPMEMLDGVIERRGDGDAAEVEVWMGSQIQTGDHQTIAGVLGLPPERVTLHTMLAGGSFGRRAQPKADFAAELASVAKAHDGAEPVKLVWTREDDIRGGHYRPLVIHRVSGAVDAEGNISHFDNTIVTQSIFAGSAFEEMVVQNGVDNSSVEGSRGLPYAIPNLRVSLHTVEAGVPVLWWRSVGHTHTAYATETVIDELLEMGGKDPIAGRRELVTADPRHVGVLDALAALLESAGEAPEGRSRGVALHKSFESYVAEAAEVSRGEGGLPRVHRVWCAVDCGVAVNPNVVTAQIEGGVGYALGALLHDQVTLGKDGVIEQSNFHDYPSLRIHEMPAVEVAIVDSGAPPTGIGEPGVPPLGPAVANAWRRLTGERVQRLPFAQGLA